MSRKKNTPSVRVINPAASSVPTSTPMPFSEVPATVAYSEAVRPKTTPLHRQLVAGGSVRIIGKSDGI